ncbi:MAG: hypothetical protein K2M91_12705 [Lachnospiraceae bacterium]|nr:hypothetical protein [Lachnospiraceae bacterium]
MKKYRIFQHDVEIGLLEINEKGQHRYTPVEEQTDGFRLLMIQEIRFNVQDR